MKKILSVMFLGLGAFGFWMFPLTPNIGSFSTQLGGERASIKRIAAEVRLRPWKKVFRVFWECSGGETECGAMTLRETIYDSNSFAIGYEVDVGSGWAQQRQCRSTEELYAIAQKGGTLKDFSQPGTP